VSKLARKSIVVTTLVVVLLMLTISVAAAAGGNYHTVRRGETLYSIGRYYGVSAQQIAQANNLYNQNFIYVGQTLYIPSYYGGGQYDKGGYNNGNNWGGYKDDGYGYNSQYHVVRRGETLSYIAYCYGVNMWSLAQANNIHNVNHVHSGQRLYIPNY
jgi:LysM repeat protein